jgi:hypothetical protein
MSRPLPRAAAIVALTMLGLAQGPAATAQEPATTHLLVIAGLGGEPKYTKSFHEWGTKLVDAATSKYGVSKSNVAFLVEKPETDAPGATGKSSKEGIEKAFADAAKRAGANDQVLIVIFGHGSYLNGESRLNLPGPDMSAEDFGALLVPFRSQKVVFVNAASASGEFVKLLSATNRTIITSTKSGMERNESLFGGYFAEAFASGGADTNKDGRVSMLEAFTYAQVEVARAYATDKRLMTEHAIIDDNGDKTGSAEPDPAKGDGALASAIYLGTAVVAGAANASPELRALYARKQQLEQQIAALRARKDTMEAARYESELEQLLVDLATTDQEIRRLEGKGD